MKKSIVFNDEKTYKEAWAYCVNVVPFSYIANDLKIELDSDHFNEENFLTEDDFVQTIIVLERIRSGKYENKYN